MLNPATTSSRDIMVIIRNVDVPAFWANRNSIRQAMNTSMDNACSTMVPVPVLVDLTISKYNAITPIMMKRPLQVGDHSAADGNGILNSGSALSSKLIPNR